MFNNYAAIYANLASNFASNPFIETALDYWQDDGFGNQIDTLSLCYNDPDRTCYIYAWLEREEYLIYSPIYYGEH